MPPTGGQTFLPGYNTWLPKAREHAPICASFSPSNAPRVYKREALQGGRPRAFVNTWLPAARIPPHWGRARRPAPHPGKLAHVRLLRLRLRLHIDRRWEEVREWYETGWRSSLQDELVCLCVPLGQVNATSGRTIPAPRARGVVAERAGSAAAVARNVLHAPHDAAIPLRHG